MNRKSKSYQVYVLRRERRHLRSNKSQVSWFKTRNELRLRVDRGAACQMVLLTPKNTEIARIKDVQKVIVINYTQPVHLHGSCSLFVQFPNQSQLFEFIQVIKRMPSITFSSPLSAIENGRPVSSDLPNLSDASTQRQIQSYLASGQAVDNANQVEQALRHMSLFRSRYDGGL